MTPLLPVAILLAALPLGALATAPEASPALRDPAPLPPWAQGTGRGHRAFHPPTREQVAMRMMVRQLLLARYDADGDSELDGTERHRLMEDAGSARRQQAQAFIRRFDADGDGILSPEERSAMKQAMAKRNSREGETATPPAPPRHAAQGNRPPHAPRRHGTRPPHPHMGKDGRMVAFMAHRLTMDAYDTDKNGILDTEESSRLREDGASLYRAREAELLARYDEDGDGRLSEVELQAAMRKLLPHPPHAAHAEGAEPPPPPPHGQGHRRNPINRLLDTHFDIDILVNLARPQAEGTATPPCAPSTPSAN